MEGSLSLNVFSSDMDVVEVGTLRDLSKKTQDNSVTPIEQVDAEANDSDSGTAINVHDSLVTYSNGDNSALMAEHQVS